MPLNKKDSPEACGTRGVKWWTIQDLNLNLVAIILFYVSKTSGIGIKIYTKFAG